MAALTLAGAAQADSGLTPSPDGLTVYDTANGITWLADFNLGASNRFGLPLCATTSSTVPCVNPSGSMNWVGAIAWVAAMNAANYLGHSDWQLPTTPLIDHGCGCCRTTEKFVRSQLLAECAGVALLQRAGPDFPEHCRSDSQQPCRSHSAIFNLIFTGRNRPTVVWGKAYSPSARGPREEIRRIISSTCCR